MRNTLLLLIVFITSLYSFGQVYDSMSLQELDEIIVHENRLQIPIEQTTRSIDVITSNDIENSPYKSLASVLQTLPGVDTRQRGVKGMQTDLSIRGSTFDENLVLINGVKLTDPQTGHHLMNLPISYMDIKKVEVVKGAAARIYGQNAYAGAVNIVTRNPKKEMFWAEMYGGLGVTDSQDSDTTYYTYGLSAGASLPGEIYSQYLSLSNRASNGYQYNSDFSNSQVYYNGNLSLFNTALKVQGGYSAREFGANGFYAGINESEKINTGLLSAELEKNLDNLRLVARAYSRINKDDYKFHRLHPEWFHNVHRTVSNGVEVNASIFSKLGITGVGWEFREEKIDGLDEEQNADATNRLLEDDFRNNSGIYFEHFFEQGDFAMTPGVYLNIHSDYDVSLYPGLDMAYSLSEKTRISMSLGRSYRVPTFFDLHYSSFAASTFGDPNLSPGIANTYELGIEKKDEKIAYEITGYYIDAENSIDWVHDINNPDINWQAMNFDNVTKYGVEITSDILSLQNSKVKNLSFFYTYLYSSLQDSNFRSRYALSHLRHKLGLMTVLNLWGSYYLSSNIIYYNRPSFTDESLLTNQITANNYLVADAKLFRKGKNNEIYLEGNNLFNARYIETGLSERPGFWLHIGIRFTMN